MRDLAFIVAALLLSTIPGASIAAGAVPEEPSKSTTASKTTAKPASSSASKTTTTRPRTWRTGQQSPTRARYKIIQQALVERGYLDGPVDGLWHKQSIAAFKKFQSDQKLKADGKINALSLIALGLGPERFSTTDSSRSIGVAAGSSP